MMFLGNPMRSMKQLTMFLGQLSSFLREFILFLGHLMIPWTVVVVPGADHRVRGADYHRQQGLGLELKQGHLHST